MDITFGISTKGKPTLIYRDFEYTKERNNQNGTTSWRCKHYQTLRCKARLITNENNLIRETKADHSHEGNIVNTLARRAVGEMKNFMNDATVTPSTAITNVIVSLDDTVLMELPKRRLMSQTLQRENNG